MFVKKRPISIETISPTNRFRKELEYLHERRMAVDGLIRALQDYDRFRVTRSDQHKQKTA